jgi:hypothetical protein
MIDLTKLKFAESPRAEFDTAAVRKSILQYGWQGMNGLDGKDPIVIKDNTVIKGHIRMKALLELGYEKI